MLLNGAQGFAVSPTTTVPPDYTLNPGDELIIGVTGSVEADLRLVVDSEGRIFIPSIGPVGVDGIKNKGEDFKRWRDAHTLGVLERIFSPGQRMPGLLRNGEQGVRGAIDMEILYDPPGHIRLPINDDEIVDRALAARPLAGRPVTLVTFDTGQTFRAREADLPVVKLTKPLGDEPAPRQRWSKAETPAKTATA